MPGAWLRRMLQGFRRGCLRGWTWLVRLPRLAARAAFSLICWLIVAALLLGVIRQVLGTPDPKVLAALLVGLLPAAFLGAYGHEVANRIKKLGPFELFAVREGAAYLEDVSLDILESPDLAPEPGGAIRVVHFSEKKRFFFDRGDRYLNYLEFSRTEPSEGQPQVEHWRLLFTFARSALASGEWTKAIYWLSRLEKLSHRGFQPSRVDNYIATSCLFSVLEGQDAGSAKERLVEAEERLSRLAREQRLDHLGYFWLAYVQDELGHWYEAVRSNEAALERRPHFAPSKYNAAVSHAKLGQYQRAYASLRSIE